MTRPSARLILVGMTLCVIGSSAAAASAEDVTDPSAGKDHVICLINQESKTGPQESLCVVLPLPVAGRS